MIALEELLPSIYAKTEQGKLDWQALGENLMIVKAGARVIGVRREMRGGQRFASLLILDDDGNTLDALSAGRVNSSKVFNQIDQLYEMARKKSLKIDTALEDVKKFLDSI